jgi:biotin carboxyl carrier protein
MQRRIDLLDDHYKVTLFGQPGDRQIQVGDAPPQSAELIAKDDLNHVIQLGEQKAGIQMAVKGETAFIHAFGRTFTLCIVDPVEQASQESGSGSDNAKAPMPGMVVEIHVDKGENVTKGEALITIESMKILTVITAPRDGEVSRVNFEQGKTFDKNNVLVTLKELVSLKKKEEA